MTEGVKKVYTKETLQNKINEDIDKMVDISKYIRKTENLLLKNTYNIKCPECKSNNIHVDQKQMRSADEGATNFYICLDCKYKWKRNN
jgi:DNA-directed RNA polymerase I subunit RPA12